MLLLKLDGLGDDTVPVVFHGLEDGQLHRVPRLIVLDI